MSVKQNNCFLALIEQAVFAIHFISVIRGTKTEQRPNRSSGGVCAIKNTTKTGQRPNRSSGGRETEMLPGGTCHFLSSSPSGNCHKSPANLIFSEGVKKIVRMCKLSPTIWSYGMFIVASIGIILNIA
jgi:hypothetical protein